MSSTSQPSPGGNQNHDQALIAMTIAMLTLSTIFVSVRFIVRIYVVKSVWWDDWTILLALIGTAVGAGLDFVEFRYGYGEHRYYIPSESYNRIQYYSYGEWIQTFATLMWTKISICLFLARIPVTKVLKLPLYIASLLLFLSNVILTLLWILQCVPVKATWDSTVKGKCFTKAQVLEIILAQGIISAISDFVLAAYPILILARVQISMRKKIGLCLLMSLGIITGACCIVRNVLNGTNESTDSTWNSIPNWMWRCLEVNFGIAAACLPTVYPGYLAVKKRVYSQRLASTEKTERSEQLLLDPRGNTRDTKATAAASASGPSVDLDLPMPEAAIIKSTRFGVRQGSDQSDSSDQALRGNHSTLSQREV